MRTDRIQNQSDHRRPIAFAEPWQFTLIYVRVSGIDRFSNYDCDENERNPVVEGKLTITPRAGA